MRKEDGGRATRGRRRLAPAEAPVLLTASRRGGRRFVRIETAAGDCFVGRLITGGDVADDSAADDVTACDAAAGDGEPSREWRLSQFFEGLFVPRYLAARGAAPATERSYRESVNWFITLVGDLAIGAIGKRQAVEFRALLETCCSIRGRRTEWPRSITVRKHCKQLGKVLRFAAPDADDDEHLALIERAPKVPMPPLELDPPDGDFTHDELQAILAACSSMRRPQLGYIDAPSWWRSLVIAASFTGLRIGTLLEIEWSMIGETHALLPARIFKGRRKGQRVFLHPQTLSALAVMWPASHGEAGRRLVFDWPHDRRLLQRHLKRLVTRAGLPLHRRFGFHGFRKYLATAIYESSGGEAEALANAQAAANHSDSRVTTGSYIRGTARERKVAEAINRLPSFEFRSITQTS